MTFFYYGIFSILKEITVDRMELTLDTKNVWVLFRFWLTG